MPRTRRRNSKDFRSSQGKFLLTLYQQLQELDRLLRGVRGLKNAPPYLGTYGAGARDRGSYGAADPENVSPVKLSNTFPPGHPSHITAPQPEREPAPLHPAEKIQKKIYSQKLAVEKIGALQRNGGGGDCEDNSSAGGFSGGAASGSALLEDDSVDQERAEMVQRFEAAGWLNMTLESYLDAATDATDFKQGSHERTWQWLRDFVVAGRSED